MRRQAPRAAPSRSPQHRKPTAVAAGFVRYWLGAGRGGFGLSPRECVAPSFYVVAYETEEDPDEQMRGWRIKTSSVPIKHPYFATLKSNNYLANVLAIMDAEASGYNTVWRPPVHVCALHAGQSAARPLKWLQRRPCLWTRLALWPRARP